MGAVMKGRQPMSWIWIGLAAFYLAGFSVLAGYFLGRTDEVRQAQHRRGERERLWAAGRGVGLN